MPQLDQFINALNLWAMQKIFAAVSIAIFIVLYYALWLITLPYFILRFAVTLIVGEEEMVEVQLVEENQGQPVGGV